MKAYLTLENGITFQGEFFGKPGEVTGEVVFTTSMTGYIEAVTDPSYYGQIILQTFPLAGNYGVISEDFQSSKAHAVAYIAKYPCQDPSNFRCEGETLDAFFMSRGLVGIKGIDTRQLAKILRDNGTLKAKITAHPPSQKDEDEIGRYEISNAIAAVSTQVKKIYGTGSKIVALLDLGVTRGAINALVERECCVHVLPHNSTAEDVLANGAQGVFISSGPGNPLDTANVEIINVIRSLMGGTVPVFGIGMGHLLMAAAQGLQLTKLLHGHRGSNQPVKDTRTGKAYITSQNHSYVVAGATSSYINVNDGTCEGMDYGRSFSVAFNPSDGPRDTRFLFDQFVERMNTNAVR